MDGWKCPHIGTTISMAGLTTTPDGSAALVTILPCTNNTYDNTCATPQ